MPALDNYLTPEEQAIVERTKDLVLGRTHEILHEDDRQGMRAFLQRAETRLSTYQRVAGVFLNGAGLLVLLPSLARESVQSTLSFAINNLGFGIFLLIPWAFAIFVPLYAFVLLLRDLVQFYFSPRFLSQDPIPITRFSLGGLTLPYDESIEAKAQVLALKAEDDSFSRFIIGGTSKRTITEAHDKSDRGKAAFPLRLAITNALDENKRSVAMSNSANIGVAFSLAGSLDLSLAAEVARIEASLCRHVLQLRKLVLRYSKALIIFVFTTITLLLVAAVLSETTLMPVAIKSFIVLLIYVAWASLSITYVRWPIRWIDRLVLDSDPAKGKDLFRDPDLEEFEHVVTRLLKLCIWLSLILAVATLMALLFPMIKPWGAQWMRDILT